MKIDLTPKKLLTRADKSTEKKTKVTMDDIYEQNAVIIEMLKAIKTQ